MLIAAKIIFEVKKLKARLSSEFETKDLDIAKKILGMKIHRNRHTGRLFLSQDMNVLECFGMHDCKPMSTPLATHFRFSAILSLQSDEKKKYMSHTLYASTVGSIMYVLVCPHPNISQTDRKSVV